MRRHRTRRGFTLIEVTIAMIVIGIMAAVLVPKMNSTLGGAQESAALQHLRTIHTAQASYFSKYGAFATSLAQLGPPPNAGLLAGELARGERMGYRFAITLSASEGYAVTARPMAARGSARSFYADGSLITRWAPGSAEATAESPELAGEQR